MKLGHFLLTRFSYRQHPEDYKDQSGDEFSRFDPLNPSCLEFRFALFETACLPNVMAQSNQDFDWVLIIDPDLPVEYRQRLETLIAKRKRTYLHEFRHDNLTSLDWLDKYIPGDTDFVLTSNLDDDDIITVDFVEKIQSHVKELGAKAPSIKFLGMKSTYQWDLYSSTKHPFGTWAPWHRTNYFKSTGLSMLCKISIRRLTVYSLHHSHGDIWYAQGSEKEKAQIARKTWGLADDEPSLFRISLLSKFQQKLEETSGPGGDDWKSLPATELHHDLGKDDLFAVHLNHFVNDQGTRLFEYKSGTVPVVDTQFFPDNFRVDWDIFHKYGELFKLSLQRYKKYWSEINSYQKELKLNWWQRLFLLVTMKTKLTWWFLRH